MTPLGDPLTHYWLAQRMAHRAGLDLAGAQVEGTLAQQDWAALVARCRGCDWVEGCERWLERHALDQSPPSVPRECPNHSAFDRLDQTNAVEV